ncbi:hypothetical protein FOCC_FOCC013948 [Frankliniella occidentalis]|nr:hypothetical protein FOCC_FOCC013948 [Frankliniella occidentalis]
MKGRDRWDALLAGPSFQLEPPARVDFANDTGAMVDCVAVGSPPPAVSWLSEGKPVADVPGALSVLHNGSLHFLPFRASGYRHDVHAATYRCVAGNLYNKINSAPYSMVLQDYVVQVFYNKNVVRGNTAILKCTIPSFVRDYITVISWLKDDSFNIYPSPKGAEIGNCSTFDSMVCFVLLENGSSKDMRMHAYDSAVSVTLLQG